MRQMLLGLMAVVAATLPLAAVSQTVDEPPPILDLVTDDSEQVTRGAALYDQHCAVCHGDTALGLAEARLAFPKDHQRCERCHKPNNPPQMTLHQMDAHNAFSVGDAPALRGEGALAAFPNASSLYHYIRAVMPRPFPGSLSDDAYLDVTALLLELNGALPNTVTLTEETAPAIALP